MEAQLINPGKSQMGIIAKKILDKINIAVKSLEKLLENDDLHCIPTDDCNLLTQTPASSGDTVSVTIFSKIMTRIFRNLENICPEFHKSSKIGPEIPNNW